MNTTSTDLSFSKTARYKSIRTRILLSCFGVLFIFAFLSVSWFSWKMTEISKQWAGSSISLIHQKHVEQLLVVYSALHAHKKDWENLKRPFSYALALERWDEVEKEFQKLATTGLTPFYDDPLYSSLSIFEGDKVRFHHSFDGIIRESYNHEFINSKKEGLFFHESLSNWVIFGNFSDKGFFTATLNQKILQKILLSYKEDLKNHGFQKSSVFLLSGSSPIGEEEPVFPTEIFDKDQVFREIKGNYWSVSFPPKTRFMIGCKISSAEVYKNAKILIFVSVIVVGALFLLLYAVLAHWIYKKILDPIDLLIRISKEMSEGRLREKILIKTGDELEILGLSLEKMAKNLAEAMENLEVKVETRTLELKERNQELILAEHAADKANEAKTRFLANMSHEIRTPLNSVVGFSQILEIMAKDYQFPPKALQYLEHIRTSGQHLGELINNILDLSKIEAGKMERCDEALQIRLLVQGIYHINRMQALKKNITFSFFVSENVPEWVILDRTRINQILLNLTSNAIKFTKEYKKVDLSCSCEDGYLYFCVQDEGIGIDPERQKSIFEAFEQADNSTIRKFGGTGLGLAIVKKMVEFLDGTIELESILDKGSRFTVKFLLQEVKEVHKSEVLQRQWNRKAKILVIEDHPMNQEMIRSLLCDLKMIPTVVSSGAEGIEWLKLNHADLILLDMHMPKMDGVQTMKEIRKNFGQTPPVIAISADAFSIQKQRALEAGIQYYLLKPLIVDELLKVFCELIPDQEQIYNPKTKESEFGETQKELYRQILLDIIKIPVWMSSEIEIKIETLKNLSREFFDQKALDFAKLLEETYRKKNPQAFETLLKEKLDERNSDRG